jgi:hypothetical protein
LNINYLYVSTVQVRDSQVRVETNVFHSMGAGQSLEPFLNNSQLAEDIIVHVDLESEYFLFLEMRLHVGVCASSLTLFVAECMAIYLKGEF